MDDKLLTPDQVAEKLAIKPKTVREWLKEGKLKGQKVGRLWRIKEKDVQRFLEGDTQEGEGD